MTDVDDMALGGSLPGPGGVVELVIPMRADLMVLARLTAAAVASRLDFGAEEIEDLRLAVEELCLSLARERSPGSSVSGSSPTVTASR